MKKPLLNKEKIGAKPKDEPVAECFPLCVDNSYTDLYIFISDKLLEINI